MKQQSAYNFVLVGVGGQGTILASDILAEVGLEAGFDVKKAEVHGMSQRGGSVISHVRWNREQVFSPMVGLGEADILLAFEKLEALRFAEYLRPGGVAVVNDMELLPITVTVGGTPYPEDGALQRVVEALGGKLRRVPGEALAKEAGNVKAANVVLLGAISRLLPLPEEVWWRCLERRIPQRFLELNRKAFQLGQSALPPAD
jgi:indolepyruvate ferredoxin oxidoreductase beta subunit